MQNSPHPILPRPFHGTEYANISQGENKTTNQTVCVNDCFSTWQELLDIESLQKMDRQLTGYRLYRYTSLSQREHCSLVVQKPSSNMCRVWVENGPPLLYGMEVWNINWYFLDTRSRNRLHWCINNINTLIFTKYTGYSYYNLLKTLCIILHS